MMGVAEFEIVQQFDEDGRPYDTWAEEFSITEPTKLIISHPFFQECSPEQIEYQDHTQLTFGEETFRYTDKCAVEFIYDEESHQARLIVQTSEDEVYPIPLVVSFALRGRGSERRMEISVRHYPLESTLLQNELIDRIGGRVI